MDRSQPQVGTKKVKTHKESDILKCIDVCVRVCVYLCMLLAGL